MPLQCPVCTRSRHPNEANRTQRLVLRLRDEALKRISELHASYDALQDPIVFPYGTDGCSIHLVARTATGQDGRKLTQLQYFSYHIMVREGNHILQMRRLFSSFWSMSTARSRQSDWALSAGSKRTCLLITSTTSVTTSWPAMVTLAMLAKGWSFQQHTEVGRGGCMRNRVMPWPMCITWEGLISSR